MLAVDSVVQGPAELLVAGRGPADRSFSRAVIDSRRVERGDLFFALHGERRDGHDFIGEALERGATGLVVERPLDAPQDVAVFQVSDALSALLGARYRVLKSPDNLNTEIGLPLTLLYLTEEHERAVLEMAMYGPGEIDLLCRIAAPQTGVVTNVGPVHLERLGSMGAIVAAKAELVEALPPDGMAILNGDEPQVAPLATRTKAG